MGLVFACEVKNLFCSNSLFPNNVADETDRWERLSYHSKTPAGFAIENLIMDRMNEAGISTNSRRPQVDAEHWTAAIYQLSVEFPEKRVTDLADYFTA